MERGSEFHCEVHSLIDYVDPFAISKSGNHLGRPWTAAAMLIEVYSKRR